MVTADSCCWDGWNATVKIKRCPFFYENHNYNYAEEENFSAEEDYYYRYYYYLPERPTCATTYCVINDYYCPHYDIRYGCMSKYE